MSCSQCNNNFIFSALYSEAYFVKIPTVTQKNPLINNKFFKFFKVLYNIFSFLRINLFFIFRLLFNLFNIWISGQKTRHLVMTKWMD